MYEKEYVFDGNCDIPVYKIRKTYATKRQDMKEIEYAVREKLEAEATKLYRLAWRMKAHGCSEKSIQKCREEARQLHSGGYWWDVLNPFVVWEYAFKF